MNENKKALVTALKNTIKDYASSIKTLKAEFKEIQRGNLNKSLWEAERKLHKTKYEFRHYHIVASILRGKTREQIEQPNEGNEPNENYIETLLEKYKKLFELAESVENSNTLLEEVC